MEDTLFYKHVIQKMEKDWENWEANLTNDYIDLVNARIEELNALDSSDLQTLHQLMFFQREKEAIKEFVKQERTLLAQVDGEKFIAQAGDNNATIESLRELNQSWAGLLDNFEKAADSLPSGKNSRTQ